MNKILVLGVAVAFCVFALYLVINRGGSVENDIDEHSAHGMHEAAITSERLFLEHMIPHHQEAVDSARVVLERGTTLRPLQELVEDIIVAQTTEIDMMKEWYRTWYQAEYENTGVYTPMMRSSEDTTAVEGDRAFLEDMIVHHEGAIISAEKMLTLPGSAETKELARTIIETQAVEITQIQELLKLLPR
jgi:uncharacterized protein (DUF305 family)